MSKKGTRSILILLISFLSLFGCPFTISADNTIVPTFAGTSSQTDWNNAGGHLTEYHESSSNNTGISKLNFSFDNHYYGIVSITYYFGPSTYSYGDVFIADGYGEFYYRNSSGSYNYVTAVRIDMVSLVIPDSNVDLSQIITLLTAIQGNTSNTVLEIQNVLDELIISNGYLDIITNLRQWNIPFESYPILINCFERNLNVVDIVNNPYNYFQFPIFKIQQNEYIYRRFWCRTGDKLYLRFYFQSDDNGNVESYSFTVLNNFTITSWTFRPIANNQSYVEAEFLCTGSSYFSLQYIESTDRLYVPLYIGFGDDISTDFALNFGLSNELLDNLNIIANGTTQSNSAAGSNDTATNEFEDIAGDMYDYEDSFNSDMNSSLNQIDTNFNIGSQFGSKFSASAQWVSQQFNTLTASTPFGSVISFSLLLGLALLIIGKVLR